MAVANEVMNAVRCSMGAVSNQGIGLSHVAEVDRAVLEECTHVPDRSVTIYPVCTGTAPNMQMQLTSAPILRLPCKRPRG